MNARTKTAAELLAELDPDVIIDNSTSGSRPRPRRRMSRDELAEEREGEDFYSFSDYENWRAGY